jgi:hypothetical protein
MPEAVSPEAMVEGFGAMAEDECMPIVSIMTDHNYLNFCHYTMSL